MCRGRKGTIIICQGLGMKLEHLEASSGKDLRYQNILYHAERQDLVNVIGYYDLSYQETWYLLGPIVFRELLETNLELIRK